MSDLRLLKNGKHWNARQVSSDGRFATEFHSKWINYLDADKEWQPINTRFYDAGDSFKMDKGPFEIEIPKYADGTALQHINNRWDARNGLEITDDPMDITIKALGIAQIRGELETADIMGSEGKPATYVIYRNAYPNADLIYYVQHERLPVLRKLIRFNSKPSFTGDARFEFEYGYDPTTVDTMIWDPDPDKVKEFMVADISAIGTHTSHKGIGFISKTSDSRGMALRSYRIWDSRPEDSSGDIKDKKSYWNNHYYERINADVTQTGTGKLKQSKIVPSTFFEKDLVYPVYCDTTSTFFPDSGTGGTTVDGRAWSGFNADWDTAHDDTSGSGFGDTDAFTQTPRCLHNTGSGGYLIVRGFYLFDTAALPDGDTISAATFALASQNVAFDEDNDGVDYVTVVQSNPASNTSLAATDYDQCGDAINNPTEGVDAGDRIDLGSWDGVDGNYNTFTLNSTGIGWIDKAGITKLGTREGHDTTDAPIASESSNHAQVYFADQAGTASDPVLTVTHAGVAAVGQNLMPLLGIS